jgi:hypothetical protein
MFIRRTLNARFRTSKALSRSVKSGRAAYAKVRFAIAARNPQTSGRHQRARGPDRQTDAVTFQKLSRDSVDPRPGSMRLTRAIVPEFAGFDVELADRIMQLSETQIVDIITNLPQLMTISLRHCFRLYEVPRGSTSCEAFATKSRTRRSAHLGGQPFAGSRENHDFGARNRPHVRHLLPNAPAICRARLTSSPCR